MSATRNKDISYEVIRSRRATADIVIERDGRVLVRAPESIPDERIKDLVEAKRYWIYKNLAEWRDLNATRVLREYRNGEGFLYLGRSYRLLLVADQEFNSLLALAQRLRRIGCYSRIPGRRYWGFLQTETGAQKNGKMINRAGFVPGTAGSAHASPKVE